jgi:hypothetical protein
MGHLRSKYKGSIAVAKFVYISAGYWVLVMLVQYSRQSHLRCLISKESSRANLLTARRGIKEYGSLRNEERLRR